MSRHVLVLFLAACSAGTSPSDGGAVPDAGVAAPVVVRVMTWNVRQLGADGGSPARVAQLIAALEPDLVTVQELSSMPTYDALLAALGDAGYGGHAGVLAQSSGGLMQAVFWRRAKLAVGSTADLFMEAADSTTFPRPPLEWRTRLLERDAGFSAIAVHLKAGTGNANEQARIDALARLDGLLRARIDAGEPDWIMLGDFNEAPSDPRFAEAFAPFAVPPLREVAPDAGVYTWLPRQLLLDHVVATTSLDAGVPFAPRLDLSEPDFLQHSDHLPLLFDVAF